MNVVVLQGRLCNEPEVKHTGTDIPVCSVRIAVDAGADPQGGRKADFINVVAWRGTATFLAKYFVKGQQIIVNGRLKSRSWEDADGQKRSTMEVVADNIYFSGSAPNASNAPSGMQAPYTAPVPSYAETGEQARFDFRNDFRPMEDDEDVPF